MQGDMMTPAQGPPEASSEKQQEGGPQMRPETELQHNSKVQLRNTGRDRPAGRCTYSITHTETLDSGLSINRAPGPSAEGVWDGPDEPGQGNKDLY